MKHQYRYLRISGVMSLGGKLELRPAYMTDSARGSERFEDSPLQMELYCKDELRLRWGASLLTHSHSKKQDDKSEETGFQSTTDFYAISAKPPITEDIDRIVFLFNETKVGEIKKPLNEPVITELDVGLYKDLVRVKWATKHPDESTLSYFVRASSDGGSSWYRVGPVTTDDELLVDPNWLVGKKCLVQVVAYDGFNTVASTAEWSGVPPELKLQIIEPESDVVVCGSLVTLRVEVEATGMNGIIDGTFGWSIDDVSQSSTLSAIAWVPKVAGISKVGVNLVCNGLSATASKRIKVIDPT